MTFVLKLYGLRVCEKVAIKDGSKGGCEVVSRIFRTFRINGHRDQEQGYYSRQAGQHPQDHG